MIGWIKALKGVGCEVGVDAIIRGQSENYAELTPEIFPLSPLSKMAIKMMGEGGANLYRGFPNLLGYYRSLKRRRPDVIIVRDLGRWFCLMAAMCAKMQGIKIIIYSQVKYGSQLSEKQFNAINKANNFFRSFWMTPISGENSYKGPSPEKLTYIPFVVDLHEGEKYDPSEVCRLLEIGKFTERKNHLLLLEALKNIKVQGHKFTLTIVGEVSNRAHEDYYSKVVNYIAENGLQGDVTIRINVPHNDMADIFKVSDLFILPATSEPASISVLEAAAYGIPVICSTTCGTKCYIRNQETGYIFEDRSVDDLMKALNWFFDQEDKQQLYRLCIENAKNEISAGNFLNLFDNALQSHFQMNLYR